MAEKGEVGTELLELRRADDDVVDAVVEGQGEAGVRAGVDIGNLFFAVPVVDAVSPEPTAITHEDVAAG